MLIPSPIRSMMFCGLLVLLLQLLFEHDVDNKEVKTINKNIVKCFFIITSSIMNGLNPVEHGYLGWYSYVKPIIIIDKTKEH